MRFFRRVPQEEKREEKQPWPTAINPCPYGGGHGAKPYTKNLWWCHGKATEICNNCVWAKEDEMRARGEKSPRFAGLRTFNPDPKGKDCTTGE